MRSSLQPGVTITGYQKETTYVSHHKKRETYIHHVKYPEQDLYYKY